jgi:hypothetical protein
MANFFRADDPNSSVVFREDTGQNQLVIVTAGSADAPFLVTNATELGYVGRGTANPPAYQNWTLAAHYRLMANITLSGNWTPIGNFTGGFDGNGFTVSGLVIAGTNNVGMFGFIGTGGVVENLGLVDVNITGSGNVGGIVGRNLGGLIKNCFVTGSVSGTSNVGGIAGDNAASSIVRNSYSTSNVSAGRIVGGIVGENIGTVQNAYSTGTISTSGTGGGIAATNSVTVQNSVALNPSIVRTTGTNSVFGRVTGSSTGSLNNHARSDMLVLGSVVTAGTGAATIHGADITETQWTDLTWWTGTATWDFSETGAWEWNAASNLPILRGFEPGTQNPQITVIPQDGGLEITLDLSQLNDQAPVLPGEPYILSRTGAGYPSSLTFTLTNPAQYSLIEWYRGNTMLHASGINPPAMTIEASTLQAGVNYSFTVEVILTSNGMLYGRTITVEVVE